MLFLKFILKIKGIKGVDTFLTNFDYLYMLNNKTETDFIELYLSYPFDESNEHKFIIFDYIRKCMIPSCKLIESTYFKTMPDEYIFDALFEIIETGINLKGFFNYLINRIDSKEFEKISKTDLNIFIKKFLSEDLIQKIVLTKNLELIIQLSNHINYYIYHKHFMKVLTNELNLEEFKNYCLLVDINSEELIYYISKYLNEDRKNTLDALFDVAYNHKQKNNISKHQKKDIYIIEFIKAIKNTDKLTQEDKNYLGEKILLTENRDYMYYWISNINSSYNYKMIDELIESQTVFSLLNVLEKNYLEYAIVNLINKDLKNGMNLIEKISSEMDLYEEEKLNDILNIFLNKGYNIPKNIALKFLTKGLDAFYPLITMYEFSNIEREVIIEKLKEQQKYDHLITYGAYLISGDSNKLLTDTVANVKDKNFQRLRTA